MILEGDDAQLHCQRLTGFSELEGRSDILRHSKEKAEVVRLEFYDKGTLKWEGHAAVSSREPEMGYTSGSRDCVMVECQTNGCPWKGRHGSVHIYFDDDNKIIVLGPHTDPMCEHIWNRLKSEIDEAVRQTREDEDMAEPNRGATQKIG